MIKGFTPSRHLEGRRHAEGSTFSRHKQGISPPYSKQELLVYALSDIHSVSSAHAAVKGTGRKGVLQQCQGNSFIARESCLHACPNQWPPTAR